MLLNLVERFMLLEILPEQGDFVTLKIIRKLRENLAPSEEEIAEFEIKGAGQKMSDGSIVPEGRVAWNQQGAEPKEIPIGEKALDIIKDAWNKLNREKRLTLAHMDLYERCIEPK